MSDFRGAWYRKPLRNGSTSPWYRDGTRGGDQVVSAAVHAIQRAVKARGFDPGPIDGLFGAKTAKAVAGFQRGDGLAADGVVGPATMRRLVAPVCRTAEAQHNVPGRLMSGKVQFESACDPGAVGSNGLDCGPAQINLGVHEVTVIDACDLRYAIQWSARRLGQAHDDLRDRARRAGTLDRVKPWHLAVLNHNWPVGARRWADQGFPPKHSSLDGRVPPSAGVATWAEFYVKRVLDSVF